MDDILATARLKIHDGKLDAFKAAANACIENVRKKDTGTLQYDWFLDEGAMECVVHERYKDSGSVLSHVGNLGDKLGALLGTADMSLEVFGSPSDELKGALGSMGAKIYGPYKGA